VKKMKWLFATLLVLQAHFAASYLVPLDREAQATFGGLLRWAWPWSIGDGGLLGQIAASGEYPVTGVWLGGGAALLFILAALAVVGWWVSFGWWRVMAIGGAMVEQAEQTTKQREERRAKAAPYRTLYQKLAGVLLSVAGAAILMGIITGEAVYPAPYSTAANTISDLGGTMPSEGGTVLQPSATIFDATMILTGAMIIIGAYFVHRTFERWAATIPLALLGTGVLGVGIFPGYVPVWHPIFALLAFVSGGIAGIMTFKVTAPPFRYVSVILGVITLVSVVLGFFFLETLGFVAALGEGGIERWIAYPVVLWLTMFGGYLMGRSRRGHPGT
jgi:hypothetical membrane protein